MFECALKREGFLREGRNQAAEPDWDTFGQKVGDRFGEVDDGEFRDAVRILTDAGPRRQVVRGGHLAWESVQRREEDSDGQFVLRLLRTARNNLFHGGKYPDGPIEEVARDKRILQAAITVLEGCYKLHPGLARWREEAA